MNCKVAVNLINDCFDEKTEGCGISTLTMVTDGLTLAVLLLGDLLSFVVSFIYILYVCYILAWPALERCPRHIRYGCIRVMS